MSASHTTSGTAATRGPWTIGIRKADGSTVVTDASFMSEAEASAEAKRLQVKHPFETFVAWPDARAALSKANGEQA